MSQEQKVVVSERTSRERGIKRTVADSHPVRASSSEFALFTLVRSVLAMTYTRGEYELGFGSLHGGSA
jgi:hypothetical protein